MDDTPTGPDGSGADDVPVVRPVAYGYVRRTRRDPVDEAVIGALRARFDTWCASHGLVLGGVFYDRGDGLDLSRPGFTGALDVLCLPASVALLVIDLDHLSPAADIQDVLARMVKRVGGQVRVVAPAPPDSTTTTPGGGDSTPVAS